MAQIALAIKYRPDNWDSVVEQDSIKLILEQQLESNSIQHCYLFVGGAGTGKTTTARIFANEINKGEGNPIELDAASNNSVDDMRDLIQQAQTKSLNSEYKVFIVDECHMITTAGWNAILKLIEEPPTKSIFIFCTTDPQKIPKTILSRVQRYDFHRISQNGIVERLEYILSKEGYTPQRTINDKSYSVDAVEYISKLADGGMRDAITLLDKCLAYSTKLSLENVVKALGTVDYSIMFQLCDAILNKDSQQLIKIIEDIHYQGKDVKQFLRQFTHFILDIQKYAIGCSWTYIDIPKLSEYEKWLSNCLNGQFDTLFKLLSVLINLNSSIKYSSVPKLDIESQLMIFVGA